MKNNIFDLPNIVNLETETFHLHNNTGKTCNQCKSIIKKENYQIYNGPLSLRPRRQWLKNL